MRKEKLSYYVMLASAVLIFLGILLGSFVLGAVYLAVIGGLFFLVGIILYIVSELRKKSD